MTIINSHTIYHNNFIDIVHDACKLCYKGKDEDTVEKKLSYIEKKIRAGHESVLEHSNVIILLEVTGDFNHMWEYAEIIESSPHLRTKYKKVDGTTYYLFSGSIRAYKNIFRNMTTPFNTNRLLRGIMSELYYVPKEFFVDFIEAGIMEHNRFKGDLHSTFTFDKYSIDCNKYNVECRDHISLIYQNIYEIVGGDGVYSIDDLLDMTTISIYFKKISRIISQQLTRHRNAISQKSQRYVDEEEASWTNPLEFNSNIPEDKVFDIEGSDFTIDELSDYLVGIYKSLRQQGVTKEDARYLLPQNVNTELYVTFTYKNLLRFLELRCHSSAQSEIRILACDILDNLEIIFDMLGIPSSNIFKYLIPKYMLTEANYDVDEIIEDLPEEEYNL